MTEPETENGFKITTEYHDEPYSSLLEKITGELVRKNVKVAELKRFGRSGAKLVLGYFDGDPLPILIKIAPFEKSEKEYNAIMDMPVHTDNDCRLWIQNLFKSGEMGALVYPHQGDSVGQNAKEPKTLGDILFSDDESLDPELPGKCVRHIIEGLREWHEVHEWDTVDLREHYEKYFHRYDSRRCIELALGNESSNEEFEYLGVDIFNPLVYEKTCLPKDTLVPRGVMHGDLHPDNIVLDRVDTAHLIDFEWSVKDRNILVDFTLLENSIRFKHFPRCADITSRLMVDQFLLDKDGYEKIMTLSFTDNTKKYYEQLTSIVRLIRQQAETILGDQFNQSDYLLTQFITLFGVVYVDGYNPYASARALGMIARKLVDEEQN